jgi:hypothetical protein
MKALRRPLPETVALISIGVIDMVATICLVRSGLCRELNPIMAPLLGVHWLAFAAVKSLTLVAAYCVCEWYRRRDECFVRKWTRLGAAAYVLIWVVWFAAGWSP